MTNKTTVQINNTDNNNNNNIQLSITSRGLTTNQKRSHQTEDVSETQESSQQSTQVKNVKRRRTY
jgi:hypothetical protein